ncbi:MAG: CdaR family protein [Eubacteriales bacterium]|jgi:YbbR domain-containing protein|nr:CdaR family protein [Eubacteriales bacterium]MDD3290407.1 CdaR family protein [Eubacteriales bacterium]
MGNSSWLDKIISVVIALILWVYVVNVINPPSSTTITGVPVQLLNQEVLAASSLAIAGTDSYTVDVVVEGARSDVIDLQADQVTAAADLFGMSKGQNYLTVSVSVPEKITVTEIKSGRIPVLIDELVSVQKPVNVKVLDEVAGFELGSISMQPQEISVMGAKSIVDQVRTVQIQVSHASLAETPSTLQLSAEAVDGNGEPVYNVRLSNAYVEITAGLYQTKTVPLEVPLEGSPAQNREITRKDIPEEITVKGSAQMLQTVEAIVAEPLNIQGLAEDISLPVTPILPDGIEIAEASRRLLAEFTLTAVAEVQFEYGPEDVWVYNVPAGYRVEVIASKITVTAKGEEAVVSVLQSKELQPAVDAAFISAGTDEAVLTTRYAQQLVQVTISPETVRVRIRIGENPTEEQQ